MHKQNIADFTKLWGIYNPNINDTWSPLVKKYLGNNNKKTLNQMC